MKKNIDKDGYLILNSCVNVVKTHPTAETPFKDDYRQVAWDLNVIGREDNRVDDIHGDVNVFTTGIRINSPMNYHFELIEHPQLFKTGYTLSGGMRIIENGDEIVVPLFKFKEVEDLELPFRAVRLILRQSEYIQIDDISSQKSNKVQKDDDSDDKIPGRRGKPQGKKNHFF